MKQLILPAALMILSFSNASATSKHSKAHAATVVNSSEFSNALAVVPSDKVQITPLRVEDQRDVDEDQPYEVIMSGMNFKGEVNFDEEGTLTSYNEEIENTQIPVAVASVIKEKYPDAIFKKDHEIICDNGKYTDEYEVYFTCGDKHGYAVVTADEQIIHSRK